MSGPAADFFPPFVTAGVSGLVSKSFDFLRASNRLSIITLSFDTSIRCKLLEQIIIDDFDDAI